MKSVQQRLAQEKDVYRPTVREGIRALFSWGWSIQKLKEDVESFNQQNMKIRCNSQSVRSKFSFYYIIFK